MNMKENPTPREMLIGVTVGATVTQDLIPLRGRNFIERLKVPDGVERIEEFAFFGAWNLRYVQFPETLRQIGKFAFYNTGLRLVVVPDDTEVADNAFPENCLVVTESQNELYTDEPVEELVEKYFHKQGDRLVTVPTNTYNNKEAYSYEG